MPEREKRATPPVNKPIPISSGVQAAKLIRQVKPTYPPLARQARISGTVRLVAIIGRDGAIRDLRVSSGHPLLVTAAVEAVKQWLYRPTLLNTEPVEVKGRVLDREGKPVADVPLFVRPEEPTAGDPAGEWTCAARQREGSEPVTAEDGTFRVLVDPGASVRIDAGWEGYPIGTASVSLRGAPDRELVLRLK